jgi:hypothetical protein
LVPTGEVVVVVDVVDVGAVVTAVVTVGAVETGGVVAGPLVVDVVFVG